MSTSLFKYQSFCVNPQLGNWDTVAEPFRLWYMTSVTTRDEQLSSMRLGFDNQTADGAEIEAFFLLFFK